jgi:hypothetical protein
LRNGDDSGWYRDWDHLSRERRHRSTRSTTGSPCSSHMKSCRSQKCQILRHDLTDQEWATITPMLPTRSRGVPRVDDRRVINGILWILRSGAPWLCSFE